MLKIAVFLNGKHTNNCVHLHTNSIDFPFIQIPYTTLNDNVVLYAADNGFKQIIENKIPFSKLYLFGDFDSLSQHYLKIAKANTNVVVQSFPAEKSFSDFGSILDHISTSQSTNEPFFIEIYGGLGNARDHEYANIQEASKFLNSVNNGGIIVFQNSLILSTLDFEITQSTTKHFSIFTDKKCAFTLHNALYSGNIVLTRPSHGLSNQIQRFPLTIKREPSKELMTLVFRDEIQKL